MIAQMNQEAESIVMYLYWRIFMEKPSQGKNLNYKNVRPGNDYNEEKQKKGWNSLEWHFSASKFNSISFTPGGSPYLSEDYKI